MTGRVRFDSWAGRTGTPVEVLEETPRRYRVRVLEPRPVRGWQVGDVVLVPKWAVTLDPAGTEEGRT